jgi:hypothetical protein
VSPERSQILPASIPDFAVIALAAEIDRPIGEAWAIIGDFQAAGRFLGVAVTVADDRQGVGSVRMVGPEIHEVLVCAFPHGYAYAQIRGPMAQHAYHGSVGLEPGGTDTCRLVYTLVYDQTSMSGDVRVQQHERLSARFGGMVQAMKAAAEGADPS